MPHGGQEESVKSAVQMPAGMLAAVLRGSAPILGAGSERAGRKIRTIRASVLAERSLATDIRRLETRHFDASARAAGAPQLSHTWADALDQVRKPVAHPFEAVEFDGQKIDRASLSGAMIRSALKLFSRCTGSGFWSYLTSQYVRSSAIASHWARNTTRMILLKRCRRH